VTSMGEIDEVSEEHGGWPFRRWVFGKPPGEGHHRVGVGVEMGGVGALVAAQGWSGRFGQWNRARAATRAPTTPNPTPAPTRPSMVCQNPYP